MDVVPPAARIRRRDARNNRDRIVEAGISTLARDPDASIEEIARAAGFARRTVYGHFPTREALVAAIADTAIGDLDQLAATADDDNPVPSLARLTLAVFGVVDRYQVVITLHREAAAQDAVREQLGGVRDRVVQLLERGQHHGAVRDDIPAAPLAMMVEGIVLGAVDGVLAGLLKPPAAARAATLAMLGAVGITRRDSIRLVDRLTAPR